MNVNKMKTVSLEPPNFELSELYHRNFQSLNHLTQLNVKQSFYEKRAKSLEKFFLQLWKSDFDDFLQITGNKCIRTNLQ